MQSNCLWFHISTLTQVKLITPVNHMGHWPLTSKPICPLFIKFHIETFSPFCNFNTHARPGGRNLCLRPVVTSRGTGRICPEPHFSPQKALATEPFKLIVTQPNQRHIHTCQQENTAVTPIKTKSIVSLCFCVHPAFTFLFVFLYLCTLLSALLTH